MSTTKTNFVSMEFDAKQMIRLLGNDLYDSPLAMLRENVQNAYDAILERRQVDSSFAPVINISIDSQEVIIEDNGIGMNREILSNNYWKAGNSGKNTLAARNAGVVGHFGIGALANFGVCKKLRIETQRLGENYRYESEANIETLNIKDSISICEYDDIKKEPGTKVIVTLETEGAINVTNATLYLKPYIEYLPIPVLINGVRVPPREISFDKKISDLCVNEGHLSYKLDIGYGQSMPLTVQIMVKEITYGGQSLTGFIYLDSRQQSLMGLRNYFGLAPISIYSAYGFGGVANLDNIIPTAGREAVSRESTKVISHIIASVEKRWTDEIGKDPLCDQYREYISYVSTNYTDSRASLIKVKVLGEGESMMQLNTVNKKNSNLYQYAYNVDNSILQQYLHSSYTILSLSDNVARRKIQSAYLTRIGVAQVSNNVQILKVYDKSKIDIEQFFVLTEIKTVIEEDYYVRDFDVKIADISHGISVLTLPNKSPMTGFTIYISPSNQELSHMSSVRQNDYKLFTPLIKDFVRLVLYQQFSSFMPKSAKERADYIARVMHNVKEEYEIGFDQTGSMEEMIAKLKRKEISETEFVRFAKAERNKHEQTINTRQVGDVSDIVKTAHVESFNTILRNQTITAEDTISPMPPILCLDNDTNKLLLKTDELSPILNGNKFFMALSARTVSRKRIFFTGPHSTRVIWSMRKLIYLFTDSTGKNTLYYDMELGTKIPDSTGGRTIKTTTILTKDKIFVPIVPELYNYFDIKSDQKLKFYIHFDELENV